ncbi:MAG: hypothetical protein KJ559_02210 [Nanoarchaeota archaeon]|nr:hypothetical protein [Nanoarchaeota archaeon]
MDDKDLLEIIHQIDLSNFESDAINWISPKHNLALGGESFTHKQPISSKNMYYTPSNPFYDARVIMGGSDSSQLETALKQFAYGEPLKIDSKSFFEKFRKQSHPNADLSQFRIGPDHGVGPSQRSNLEVKSRWYDSPYTFVLSCGFEPVATLSFKGKEGAILIDQIQGIKGVYELLRPLKWARALIGIVCYWATQNNIPEVQVLPHSRASSPTVQEYGKMNYDVPAKRNGFRYDPELGLYKKRITVAKI